MNDRHLFKAKRVDTGEWIMGDLITTPFLKSGTREQIPYILDVTKADYDCFEDLTDGNGYFEVDPATVCRCTGLKDKNGRLIWEGDILKSVTKDKKKVKRDESDLFDTVFGENKESVWTIEYKERRTHGHGFYFYGTDRRFSIRASQSVIWNCQCEVIGNIFDNAELLEVQEC